MGMISAAWRYRFFILSSIKTEFRSQFVRSKLGGFWIILQPLLQVLIFTFVLSSIMLTKLPGISDHYGYSTYLMSGMLCWSLFLEIITRCVNLFVEQGNLIKKIAFPKIVLPLILVGRALTNNIFLLLAIGLIFIILGHYPGITILYLPILIIITIMFALGLGLILGVFNVFIRDIGQAMPIILQIWFWLTPIVYMLNIMPEHDQIYLKLNPLTLLIQGYQSILLYNQAPFWSSVSIVFVISLILLVFSLFLFRRANAEIVDQL